MRDNKLEEVLVTLKENGAQETWRLNVEELKHIDTGCSSINHGLKDRSCRRGSLGVMIILSPLVVKAYVRGGSKKKTFGDRTISVPKGNSKSV